MLELIDIIKDVKMDIKNSKEISREEVSN